MLAVAPESEPTSPPRKRRMSRRRLIEWFAISTGTAKVVSAIGYQGYAGSGAITIQVDHEIPQILFSADNFKAKRDTLVATKPRTPEQDDSIRMMNQTIQFHEVQEPRRKARRTQLHAEFDEKIVIPGINQRDLVDGLFYGGAALIAAGILSMSKLPDRLIRKAMSYLPKRA